MEQSPRLRQDYRGVRRAACSEFTVAIGAVALQPGLSASETRERCWLLARQPRISLRSIRATSCTEIRMSKLRLTFACGPYDRTQSLRDGSLQPEGIDLNYVALQPAEIFWRMLRYREFDASEMSLSNYTSLVSDGDAPFIAIPVFPSRVFRHGYFFINTTKGIEKPADLAGKRGGVPEYSMTAAVYMRGLLQHEYGVKPTQVEWVQGRTDRLGRALPSDIKLTQAPAGTELGDLLEKGGLDFLMTANNPLSFRRGSPHVRRLFPNYMELEKDYYRRTKIYPIMHTVVIRREVYESNPWVALSMYKALFEAKEHA